MKTRQLLLLFAALLAFPLAVGADTVKTDASDHNLLATESTDGSETESVIEGIYLTQPDSYRLYNGNSMTYGSAFEIQISDNGDGTYYVDDLFGGWYSQRSGYGSDYAMTGIIEIAADGTVSLIDSYVSGWGDSLTSLTGTYDAESSTFTIEAEYNGMKFHQTWVKVGEAEAQVFKRDGILYGFGENNTVFVKPGNYSGDIVIPDEVSYKGKTYSVTSIGENAFKGCSGLTSITIPNSVTSIGHFAFCDCSGLTSISIPNSIVSLEAQAFYLCSGLTSITIPSSVSYIGDGAFGFCSGLTSITVEGGNATYDSRDNCNAIIATETNELIAGCMNSVIPNTVSSIGNEAFEGCYGLTSIIIPNSITSIGSWAFNECTGLTSVILPNSIASIGSWAFNECTGLTSFILPSSVTSIEEYTFCDCRGLTSITIPNSVTSIGIAAFQGCTGLTYIPIPESVTSIESSVFDGCSGLTSITIPNWVTSIGLSAFSGCYGLTSVTIPNSVTSIGSYAFWGCTSLTEIHSMIEEPFEIEENVFQNRNYATYTTEFTSATLYVPNGTKAKYEATPAWNQFQNIVDMAAPIEFVDATVKALCEAFWDTNSDGELSYAEAAVVTDLGEVFQYLSITSFNELKYFTGLTTIGNDAFLYCKDLTEITIPSSVSTIGSNAFEGCSGLTSITIPNSVTSIGAWAFRCCSSLKEIHSMIEEPFEIEENVFLCLNENGYDEFTTATLHVPAGTKAKYEATPAWNLFQNIVDMNDPIEFADATVKAICVANWDTDGDNELSYAEAAAVTELREVFQYSEIISFDELQYFTGLTNIGAWAFEECSGLTSITIPESVTSIAYAAFYGCRSLTSIEVDSDNPVFDSRDNCNAIIVKKTNELISGCKNTIIPNTVTSIGYAAFGGCSGLISIIIPNSVTTIGSLAFYECSGITFVTIPSSVTSIEKSAFKYCSSLTEIRSMIKEPFEINENVFQYCNTSATLYVPAGTKEKYEATYAWNLFENIVEMDMEPIEDGETVDFAEEIDEDTNLDGNVVGDIYYNISDEDGSYDAEEGCIVVTTPTDDDTMSELEGQDIFGENFKDSFTGIVFKVAPGKGTIKVEAQTTGSMVLKVKIGNADPITMELEGKLKVSIPYNVSEETYIYIYGGSNATQAKDMRKAGSDGELRIYGIEIAHESVSTDIDANNPSTLNTQPSSIYDLQGYQHNDMRKGVNIIRMGDGTARKVIRK